MPQKPILFSRRFIQALPFGEGSAVDPKIPWHDAVTWPCSWIGRPGNPAGPWAAAFRCGFEIDAPLETMIHLAADQQYQLYIDGEVAARGGELGDKNNWYADSFALHLAAGRHVFVAEVINYGPLSPWCMMSVLPGFFLCPEDKRAIELFGTGIAPWTVKQLPGYLWTDSSAQYGQVVGTGPCLTIDARNFSWEFALGAGEDWGPIEIHEPGNNGYITCPSHQAHLLKPATLPDRTGAPIEGIRLCAILDRETETFPGGQPNAEAKREWEQLMAGQGSLSVPPQAIRLVLLELGNYYCAYPKITTIEGKDAEISVLWAETLRPGPDFRGKKDSLLDVERKSFSGYGDTFILDGGLKRSFQPVNWRCGCYVLLKIKTSGRPLALHELKFYETRYPLESITTFQADDRRLTKIRDVALRTLQMCMHDTYMDCPYYERLMYVGDTRIQALITYAISLDDRLPRKALHLFDASRVNFEHLTLGAYPGTTKFIPPSRFGGLAWFTITRFGGAIPPSSAR